MMRSHALSANAGIIQHEVMTLIGTAEIGTPVVVAWGYDPEEPAVVTLTVHPAAGAGVRRSWAIDRNLVHVGTDEAVSDDSTRVSPVWHPQAGIAVLLELDAEDGPLLLRGDVRSVRRFADRTFSCAPVRRIPPATAPWGHPVSRTKESSRIPSASAHRWTSGQGRCAGSAPC